MILRRLLAIDTLKYGRVELSDLPSRGVILITGSNESGKSTIGEIVCLALFGRTFALPPERIEKAVRWDQPKAAIELDFEIDGAPWRLHRSIDRTGSTSATLARASGADEVSGWGPVTVQVEQLLGYGFNEFVESFYLARREIATPHPRSQTVRAMAGVLPLEEAAGDLRERLENEEQRMGAALESIEELGEKLEEARGDRDIPLRRSAAEQRAEALTELVGDLEAGLPDLDRAVDQLSRADEGTSLGRWRSIAGGLRHGIEEGQRIAHELPFPATLELEAFGRAADKVDQALDAYQQLRDAVRPRRERLAALLAEPGVTSPGVVSFESEEHELLMQLRGLSRQRGFWATAATVLGGAAVAAAVIAMVPIDGISETVVLGARIAIGLLVLGAIGVGLKVQTVGRSIIEIKDEQDEIDSRRQRALREAAHLDLLGELPPARAAEHLASGATGEVAAAAKRYREGAGRRLIDEDARAALNDGLAEPLSAVVDAFEGFREQADAELAVLEHMKELFEERSELQSEIASSEDRIATWGLAVELLDASAKELTFAFNRDVRRSMSRILPGLTEGRYQYLQIDDDFQVRVFSSDKQDFVLYEEISGGTQRQIALATRMALSEGLVRTCGLKEQFLFLDEPFAFFDAERTRLSMGKLPTLSEHLGQLFIAAQEPPEGGAWDLHVQTSRDTLELAVSGARL